MCTCGLMLKVLTAGVSRAPGGVKRSGYDALPGGDAGPHTRDGYARAPMSALQQLGESPDRRGADPS